MDCAVENLKKTSDIERKTTINKLHNMQWLKNTSHSANPEKIKAVISKQEKNEDMKTEDKVLAPIKTVETHSSEDPNKYFSTDDTCKTYLLCSNTMSENENMWSKNIDTAKLLSNADKLADQKNEEDVLSIVESIVTAKLEAEFYTNKEHKDETSTLKNDAKNIIQNTICTSPSNVQKTDSGPDELKLIKDSDGNNNDPKSITPCISKVNNEQKSTCKITKIQTNKVSTETKDKDAYVKTNNTTKTDITAGNNTHLIKDNEKSSNPSNDSKKTVSNFKSLSPTDKNGKDNKQNNTRIACTRKQEFVKQRIVSRNVTEKEIKSTIAKPNLTKTGVETIDTICQNKNLNKTLQKQQPIFKQCITKSKVQESLKKNVSNSSDDKSKMEKAMHTPEKIISPLNESEKKNEKIVNEKNVHSDQKPIRSVDVRKNTTFVAQYKNSTFSKSTQNVPRIGQSSMYGRSPYAYNNPKFDRDRNSAERRVTKKEHTPINTLAKSNTGTEEPHTSNLENCAKQKKEIIQPTNVKLTCEVDTLVNDKKDINPAKIEVPPLVQSMKDTSSNIVQGSTSEQRVETNISKIGLDQQHKKTNNEETASFKAPSNLPSDKYANSQLNVINQYSLKFENMQRTNDVSQLKSGQTIWNQSDQSDNAAQKDAIMSVQQSVQNMRFNTQQTFTPAGNPTRQMSLWEPNNSKFYDQYFSVSDAMQLSQIPNTFNAPSYEYSASISGDNNVTATLETMSNSRENSNAFYRYGLQNIQQRPVMASDFPDHSMSPSQANQARWSSSVDNFHVEHPYATQPIMMHVYNPAVFGPDDFNNTHMDYISHPIIYAPSPYMQTWNSQLQLHPMPVLYNSPCTTFSHDHQPNNFNNSMHDQQHKHNPYAQMNNCVRDTYNDTNICAAQARNITDNVPTKSNYYKKPQDNSRATYDVPQYVPPVSYSRSQQDMHFMPATDINPYVSYCPNQKHYRQSAANYMKSPRSQMQDFTCDDGSEDPPIICPKEFVTNDINPLNKTDQFATRVFRPEFKKSNSGYRPPSSYSKYSGGFHRNTTVQGLPEEYTYPISIGRGMYKTKKM